GGQPAPLNIGKDNFFTNMFTGVSNNEYNRPAHWWRDLTALSGKQFVDMGAADAKRYATRNWNQRLEMGAWDALGYGLYSIPGVGIPAGLAYDYLLKPVITEPTKRRYEYANFIDRVGARNVGAGVTGTGRGGFSDAQQFDIAREVQGMHRGSGFKKSQWDELVQTSESYGYFKTYDKNTVDSFKQKFDALAGDAKYAMQTLHVSATEAAKILGDLNTMGIKGSVRQINMLNQASAYTGLSGAQVSEFAQGRAGMYKAMGYTERGGYNAGITELVDTIKAWGPGERPRHQEVLQFKDAMGGLYKQDGTNNSLNWMMAYMDYDSGTEDLVFNVQKYKEESGTKSMKASIAEGAAKLSGLPSDVVASISHGAINAAITHQFKSSPLMGEGIRQRSALMDTIVRAYPSLMDKPPDEIKQTIMANPTMQYGLVEKFSDMGVAITAEDIMKIIGENAGNIWSPDMSQYGSGVKITGNKRGPKDRLMDIGGDNMYGYMPDQFQRLIGESSEKKETSQEVYNRIAARRGDTTKFGLWWWAGWEELLSPGATRRDAETFDGGKIVDEATRAAAGLTAFSDKAATKKYRKWVGGGLQEEDFYAQSPDVRAMFISNMQKERYDPSQVFYTPSSGITASNAVYNFLGGDKLEEKQRPIVRTFANDETTLALLHQASQRPYGDRETRESMIQHAMNAGISSQSATSIADRLM
ncbi:MAG: hypothetical protein Q8M92_09190, partial [Candidatus Subteraquimicrobiales bacterium]|nr:hypothetical protein [Candidatus Subteraquimicrobiales bacterium]